MGGLFSGTPVVGYCIVPLHSRDLRGRLGHYEGKKSVCMGFSSHLDHGPPFCFIFLGSVTAHHLFYSFNLKAAEAASTIVATA